MQDSRNPEGISMTDLTRTARSSVRIQSTLVSGTGSPLKPVAAAGLLAGLMMLAGPSPASAQDFFNIGRAIMQNHMGGGGGGYYYSRRHHRGGGGSTQHSSRNGSDSPAEAAQTPAQQPAAGTSSAPPPSAASAQARGEPRGGPEFTPPK
jgi:hypothetical protein